MDIERLKHLPADERKQILEFDTDGVESGPYTKPLSDEEISTYQNILAQNSIDQAVLVEEFDRAKKQHKAKLEPIKKEIAKAINAIKTKSVEVNGKLFKIKDHDNHMIYKVDEAGNVINSRNMLPEERQYHLKALNQKSA